MAVRLWKRIIPLANPMHWNPDLDIVPFRPEESVAWRLEAIRRDVVQLNADHLEARNQAEQRDRLLRVGESLSAARDAVAGLGEAMRVMLPSLADSLAAVGVRPSDVPADGTPLTVRLQGGQEVAVRRRGDFTEARVVENRWPDRELYQYADPDADRDLVITGQSFTVDFPVSVGMADWFERLMDSMLRPPEPTPGTFLTRAVQQAARQDPDIPGIEFWDRVHRTADILPSGACSQDTVNIRTGEPGQPWRNADGAPTSWRDIDPGRTFRDQLQEDAGQEFTDRLLERYGELVRSPQSLFSPEDWAASQQAVREDYERTTGLRWGATSADGDGAFLPHCGCPDWDAGRDHEPHVRGLPWMPGRRVHCNGHPPNGSTRTVVSVDPAAADPASGATAWVIPLDADGNPTGTPRALGRVGSITWEAEPDVRGGHL